MFKPLTNIFSSRSKDEYLLPTVNPIVIDQGLQQPSKVKQLAKAGLVFAATTGTFLALKATGSFSLVSKLLSSEDEGLTDRGVANPRSLYGKEENRRVDYGAAIELLSPRVKWPESEKSVATRFRHFGRAFETPVLETNKLLIYRGGTKVFTTDNLSATDPDDDDTTLLFTITDSQHGEFQFLNGTAVNTFPQQEIISRNIQFVHDGSNITPAYKVDVSDGSLTTTPAAASITLTSGYGPYGTEFQVNTHTTNMQFSESIAALADGKFVVVYESDLNGWYTPDIRGQMYYNNGTRYGTEFMANDYTASLGEGSPTVADLKDGSFVVVWHAATFAGDNTADIYGQIYNYNGTRYGSRFQVSTYMDDSHHSSNVASLSGDKFVATWISQEYVLPTGQDGSADGVFAQMFYNNGTQFGSEFQVNTYTIDNQHLYKSSVAGLNDGKFVIVWHSYGQDTSLVSVYGQMYNNDGSLYGGEFKANTSPDNGQGQANVANLSDGKFVITWEADTDQDGSAKGVYGQMYNNDGTRYGSEFQVNTYTTSDQGQAASVALTNERFIITWTSNAQDGSDYGIYGQVFYNDGTSYGNEFQINTYTNSRQHGSYITSLTNGKFVVVWTGGYWSIGHQDGSDAGVYGQMFEENIAPTLGNNTLTINQGQGVVLSGTELSATDIDNDDMNLTFTVENIQYGQFELVSNGTDITQFTQQQVAAGDIQFVHDGGELAPSYNVSVSDGTLSTPSAAASITFTNINDAPVLGNNTLTIDEGETVLLTPAILSATDVDNDDMSLTFTVENTQYGQFELVNNGTDVTSFTQQQIIDSDIQFAHDGGELAPSYQVSVSDGALSTTPASAAITFTNINDAPVLGNNTLTIEEGETVLLTPSMLSATDEDHDDTTLIFTVNNLQYGQFEVETGPGIWTAMTSFTQQQIIDGVVRFVQEGSKNAPIYDVVVSDGSLSTSPALAAITFIPSISNSVSSLVSNSQLVNNTSSSKVSDSASSSTSSIISSLDSLSSAGSSSETNSLTVSSQASKTSQLSISTTSQSSNTLSSFFSRDSGSKFSSSSSNLLNLQSSEEGGGLSTVAEIVWKAILGAAGAGIVGLGFFGIQRYIRISIRDKQEFINKYPFTAELLEAMKYNFAINIKSQAGKDFADFIEREKTGLKDKLRDKGINNDSLPTREKKQLKDDIKDVLINALPEKNTCLCYRKLTTEDVEAIDTVDNMKDLVDEISQKFNTFELQELQKSQDIEFIV